MVPYPSLQKSRARKLRENQTDVESKLWWRLRHRQLNGAKFRRQHPIGPFIVDFCVETGLVVELDGGSMRLESMRTSNEPRSLKVVAIEFCVFGITKWPAI